MLMPVSGYGPWSSSPDRWALASRDLFAVSDGIAAAVWPGMTLVVLVLVSDPFALMEGLAAWGARPTSPR
jgi:hypothetical protein